MNVIGVIPARYQSSRLPGKPLADICGKPMIWWVYQQAKKVQGLSEVYIATDDERVVSVCENCKMNVVMTSPEHASHVHRLLEFASQKEADAYLCICGDEPLIEPSVIEALIPSAPVQKNIPLVRGVMRELNDPVETMDSGNIKIITNTKGDCLALSRTPIPYPYKSVLFKYKKTIGIECFNKVALEFYVNTEKGTWEQAEDIMMLRFIENRIPVHFSLVYSSSLSVDTPKDLEKVRKLMQEKLQEES